MVLYNLKSFKMVDTFLYSKDYFFFHIIYLMTFFSNYIEKLIILDVMDVTIKLKDSQKIVEFLSILQKSSCTYFRNFVAVHGIDYPGDFNRFYVVYNILNVNSCGRLRILITTSERKGVQTISSLYKGSEWFERELWDMFGIFFFNNKDLRRILTDYGFEGFPLRKDFPVTGYIEVRYDDSQKCVVYEPLEVTQEFRNFEFLSPWAYTSTGIRIMRKQLNNS